MDISVIIPCFNAEKWISTCVDSCLANSSNISLEVIVVDDGSSDSTYAKLEQYGDQITLLRQSNHGACAARNLGLSISSGDFIIFLDADDFFLPGSLPSHHAFIKGLSSDCFAYGFCMTMNTETGRITPYETISYSSSGPSRLQQLLLNPPPTSSWIYPRSMLMEVGGFNESLLRLQDTHLLYSLVRAGYTPVHSPVSVYVYRDHCDTSRISKRKSPSSYSSILEAFTPLSRTLESQPYILRKQFSLALSKMLWIVARDCLRQSNPREAQMLFAQSFAISGISAISGSLPYKLLVLVLGPLPAEMILESIKQSLFRVLPRS